MSRVTLVVIGPEGLKWCGSFLPHWHNGPVAVGGILPSTCLKLLYLCHKRPGLAAVGYDFLTDRILNVDASDPEVTYSVINRPRYDYGSGAKAGTLTRKDGPKCCSVTGGHAYPSKDIL